MRAAPNTEKKTILIYGLTMPQLLELNRSAAEYGIVCRAVSPGQTALTVDELLSGGQLPAVPAIPLMGKFALLDGFQGQEQVATALINQITPGVIKAVHTAHNGSWRFFELCSAISEEHRAIKAKSGRK